jgi:hypothetical protein
MNEDGLSLVIRDGQVILDDWRDDLPDDEELPFEAHLRAITFPIPETADEALRQLIQANYWPDDPGEREDFFWHYREAMERHVRQLRLPS